MQALRWANAAVAFLLELALLAALAYWGVTADEDLLVRIALGVGAPALVILVWATLLAPKSRRRLRMPWLLIAKLVLFGLGAYALATTGRVGLAVTLAAVAAVSLVVTAIWGEQLTASPAGTR